MQDNIDNNNFDDHNFIDGFDDQRLHFVSDVSNFMMEITHKFPERCSYNFQTGEFGGIPYGDMPYGSALSDWDSRGRDSDAFFSWAEGQQECPYLNEFRKEISAHFGLQILTREEAEYALTQRKFKTKKVHDWGDVGSVISNIERSFNL